MFAQLDVQYSDNGPMAVDEQPLRFLAVDDSPGALAFYKEAFHTAGNGPSGKSAYELTCCRKQETALQKVQSGLKEDRPFAVAFVNLHVGSEGGGLPLGEKIRRVDPHIHFVFVSGTAGVPVSEIVARVPPPENMLYVQVPVFAREIRQFGAALGAKWRSEGQLKMANAALQKKVEELEHSQNALLENTVELENATRQLMETNDALSVLARNLENSRKESEKRVFQKAVTLMMPIIEKLAQNPRLKPHRTDLRLLAGYVKELTSGGDDAFKASAVLTGTEMRIAGMIRNGMSSNAIGRHLCISPATVKTHRKHIRRKLNLQHSRINLRAYLASQMGDDTAAGG